MNRAVARVGMAALRLGVKARTIWLCTLFGFALGCWFITAWAYMLRFATPQAISLLQWLGEVA